MQQEKVQKILENIKTKFEDIENEFGKLPSQIQNNINECHSSNTLNSLVRWGSQTTEEVIFDIDEVCKNA
ncbi:MAG: hypothetical protein PF569_08100 [Candidatus Woesearchaeota archaeon]|jgi:archaellum component FlaC|nr:hypothetical protein [Candidatus Woesearchaeota archaeon]